MHHVILQARGGLKMEQSSSTDLNMTTETSAPPANTKPHEPSYPPVYIRKSVLLLTRSSDMSVNCAGKNEEKKNDKKMAKNF